MSILSRIFNRNVISSTGRIAHQRRPRRLFEALEPRVMLSATPVITSATISAVAGTSNNYSIILNGTNLGNSTSPTGGGDITLVDPGVFTGGQTGDAVTLNVTSWTTDPTTGASSITIAGLTGSYGTNGWVISPADSLVIAVVNPQTNISAVTNLTTPGTPEVTGAFMQPISGGNNWQVFLSGHGLGNQAAYLGNSADLSVLDPGILQAGYSNDAVTANVGLWNNDQIVINGFNGAYGQNGWTISAGNSLSFNISNPQDSLAASTFNYTVPGTNATPSIAGVFAQPISGTNNCQVFISGSNFGTQAAFNGDSSDLVVVDPGVVAAGHKGDAVTANVTSWDNSQIVISGFSGAYGSNGWVLGSGNTVLFEVTNPQSGITSAVFSATLG